MENNKEKQEGQFQLELPQAVAQGEYANFALITHSRSEFIADFARVLPGLPKAVINSRVIIAPEHAKRQHMALQENVAKCEHEFGKITLPEQQGKTIAPFNINKGEA